MEALSELEEERREAKGRKEAAFRQRKAGGKARFRRKEKERMAVPKGVASNEMCTFLIINISSLQLISVNMLAYRSQYGSVNPSAVVGPGILATIVSTLAAVVYCKIMDRSQ